jgi:hypothetical protein
MLEAKLGERPPEPPPINQPEEDLNQFKGAYESQSYWAKLEVRDDGTLVGNISGQVTRFIAVAGLKFSADGRIADSVPVTFERDAAGKISGFTMETQKFTRVPLNPLPLPAEWRAFLGSYGPDFIPFIVTERHGHLYAMTENMVDYRLTPVNRHVCALPPGMYVDEYAVFLTGADDMPHTIDFGNMILPRR